ncbi:MAG: hypothetical protein AB8B91_09660 [Rubripirellula sp.]
MTLRRLQRRFARIEQLEARVVLDGTSQLGAIQPAELSTIDFPVNDDFSRIVHPARPIDANTGTLGHFGAGVLRYSLDAVEFDNYVMDWHLEQTRADVGDTGSHFVADAEALRGPSTVEITPVVPAEPLEAVVPIDQQQPINAVVRFETPASSTVNVKSTFESTVSETPADHSPVYLSTRGDDPGLLDDPSEIPFPPVRGILSPSPSPHEPSSLASIASLIRSQPDGGSEESTERIAERQPASATPDQASTVAMTQDRYFQDGQSPRTAVAWSAHASASTTRRHVAAFQTANRNSTPTSHDVVLVNRPQTNNDTDTHAPALERLVQTIAETIWLQSNREPNAISFGSQPAESESIERSRHETRMVVQSNDGLFHEPTDVIDEEIRDALIAQYQPLSILIGVSLVSAHLIADARQEKRVDNRRLRR